MSRTDILSILCEVALRWMPQDLFDNNPDSKIHGANMVPTWVLSTPDGPHVGPMNLAIREVNIWGSGYVPLITRTKVEPALHDDCHQMETFSALLALCVGN